MAEPYRRMKPLLGTFVEIGLTSKNVDAVNSAFEVIALIQKLLSFHDSSSDLSRLNLSGSEEIEIHPLSAKVLLAAKAMTVASGELFNLTVGGEIVRRNILPDLGFKPFLDAGNGNDVLLNGASVKLRRPVLVTLDGIAKGFAVDLAVSTLKKFGCSAGWVNAGGDLRIFGEIQQPMHRRLLSGEIEHLGWMGDCAIATSRAGDSPSARFGGLIPASNEALWTVSARYAWRADALTKVAAKAPKGKRDFLVNSLGGKILRPQIEVAG